MAEKPNEIVAEDEEIIDDASQDDTVIPERYDISSYGADFDVEGLVRRLDRKDVFVPPWQRDFIWKLPEASRFIESLLLGLPVPGIFLAREPESNKLLVIDGQQRLKTLQYFYQGLFDPKPEEKTHRVFALTKVQGKFNGLTYNTLEERDRIKLGDSIIHATVVKQESPEDDDTSIYHIFERLNNGGRRLMPQEIRTALYHGTFVDLIRDLNDYEPWRQIYGKKNNRLKDQELILRFLALLFDAERYERPMEEFLNKFAKRNQNAQARFLLDCETVFTSTIKFISQALDNKAFRPEGPINAAVFDSVMVGLARRLIGNPVENIEAVQAAYYGLLKDEAYSTAVSYATSNERSVETRLRKSTEAFANI